VNKLNGTIVSVQSSPEISMVEVDVSGDVFSAVVLETPANAPYLKVGTKVEIIFKETEVSIAKNLSGLISIRNRFKAGIKKIEKHTILTTVVLTYKTNEITSIISTKSSQRLDLTEGEDVEWLVKTNEVSLCPLT
jgi:molybdate transport system regulatory protein